MGTFSIFVINKVRY
ncbi:TPA: erythromycin resistance leader peptide, partial [Staphylococcus aureus]|nr:erythromycin resistance leader peptide [Staphylococcus aureus]HDG5564901.1 erythromycin resistance leader peptide [Staphylococcus aureus]HDG5796125.1 erythromycin resistance leader peptide [Staphylococcus aureus]HDG5818734.1 erythromycin resistance leader peptide [Staphylococcus aureus]HDG5844520.1 erythromycin resistance leader peptide [Staphylococcus aureus]